jgi:hypothetical protein
MNDEIRAIEAKRDREWTRLEAKRQHYNELTFDVGDRQRELSAIAEEITTSLDTLKNSDNEQVHEAYITSKREIDGYLDKFKSQLNAKRMEFEDAYDDATRDIQRMNDKYDDEIGLIRRNN